MRVIVACEFSGIVRDAFLRHGHDAISVDLLPTESPGPHHQGDIFAFLERGDHFDLMISHWDCTFLTRAGRHWLFYGGGRLRNPERFKKMEVSATCFARLANWPHIEHIAAENPLMHEFATEIIGRKQTQIVHPYWFGHKKLKRTGLWLKNLPDLDWTDYVGPPPPNGTRWYKDWADVHYASPGPDRWKERSRTYTGFADAMAQQWGNYLIQRNNS